MNRTPGKEPAKNDRTFDAGIEWIIARELAPMQDEILRLRAFVEALAEVREPC